MEVVGVPAVTLSRGTVVWDRGQLDAVRGAGRYVDRPCWPAYAEALRTARAQD